MFSYKCQFWPVVLINSTVAQHYHQIAIDNKENVERMEESSDVLARTYAMVIEQLNIASKISCQLVNNSVRSGKFCESYQNSHHSDEQSAKRFQHALFITLEYHDHLFSQFYVNPSVSSSDTTLQCLERQKKCKYSVEETLHADHNITLTRVSCTNEPAELSFHISDREIELLSLMQHWIYQTAYTISRECFVSHQSVLKTALLGPSDLYKRLLQQNYKPSHLRVLQLLMRGGKSYLELLVRYNVRPQSKREWEHLMNTLNIGNLSTVQEIVNVNTNIEPVTKNVNFVSHSGSVRWEASNRINCLILLHVPLLDNHFILNNKSEKEQRCISRKNAKFTRTSEFKDTNMCISLRRYQHKLRALCGWRELFALIRWRVEFAACNANETHIASTAIQYVLTRYVQEEEEEEEGEEEYAPMYKKEDSNQSEHKKTLENKFIQEEAETKLGKNDGELMTYYLNSSNVTRHTLEQMLKNAKAREAKWLVLAKACGIDKNNKLKLFVESCNDKNYSSEELIGDNQNNCIEIADNHSKNDQELRNKQGERIVSLQEVDNVTLNGQWCIALRGLLDYIMNYLERTSVTHKQTLYALRKRYCRLRSELDRCIVLQKEVRIDFNNNINTEHKEIVKQSGASADMFASCVNAIWTQTFEWIDFALSSYSHQNKVRTKLLTHQWAAVPHAKRAKQSSSNRMSAMEEQKQFTMLSEQEARAVMTFAERDLIIQPPIAALDVLSQNNRKSLTLSRENEVNLIDSLAEEEKKSGRSTTMPASFVIDLRRRLLLLKAAMEKNIHTPLSLVEFEGTRHHKTRKRLLPFITHQLRVELLPRIVMMILASIMELTLIQECNYNREGIKTKNCNDNNEIDGSKSEGVELLLKYFEEWIVKDVRRSYKSYSSLHEYFSQILIYNGQTLIAALLEEYVGVLSPIEFKNEEAELQINSHVQKQEWILHENNKMLLEELQKQEWEQLNHKKKKEIKLERAAHTLRAILVKVVNIVLQPHFKVNTYILDNDNTLTPWVNGETKNSIDVNQSSEKNNIDNNGSRNNKNNENAKLREFWSTFDELNVCKNVLEKRVVAKVKDGNSSNNMLTVPTKIVSHSLHVLLIDAAMTFDNYLYSLRAETVAQVGNLEDLLSALIKVQPSYSAECVKKEANDVDVIHVLAPESMQVVLKALLLHFLHIMSNKTKEEIESETDVNCSFNDIYNDKDNEFAHHHHLCVHGIIKKWFRHHSSLRTLFCAIPVHDVCSVQESDAQLRLYLQGMYHPEYIEILQDDKVVADNEECGIDTSRTADKNTQENHFTDKKNNSKENCIDLLVGRCYRHVTSSPMSALCKKENKIMKQIFSMLQKESERRPTYIRNDAKNTSRKHEKTEVDLVLPCSSKLNVVFVCVNVEKAMEHFVCKVNKVNSFCTSEGELTCVNTNSFPVEHPVILAGGSSNICNSLPFQLLALRKPTQVNCTLHATLPSLVEYMLASLLQKEKQYFAWSKPQEQRSLYAHATQNHNANTPLSRFASQHSSCLPILHEHGLLNRLDVGTSGIVLVCTSWAQLLLARRAALQYKSFRKTYRSIVMSSIDAWNSNYNGKDHNSDNHIFYLPLKGVVYDSVVAVVQPVAGNGLEPTKRTKTRKNKTVLNEHDNTYEYNSTKTEKEKEGDEMNNKAECSETDEMVKCSYGEQSITQNVFYHNNESNWAVQHMSFTRFRVLQYNPVNSVYELEVQFRSGKRHQIRQHFCNIGFPLVGDSRYNIRWRRILSLCNRSEEKVKTHNTLEQKQEGNELIEMEEEQTQREKLVGRRLKEGTEATNMKTKMAMMIMADRLALHASSIEIRELPLSRTSFLSTSTKNGYRANDMKYTATAVVTCPLPEDYTKLLRTWFAESFYIPQNLTQMTFDVNL